jgi:hypothetical protein
VRPLFEAQLHAYDYVLDLATQSVPVTEAGIRKLHEVVCEAQATYRVMTAVGPQEQELTKGRYKVLPNHVLTRDGVTHSYAPVDVTPAEMARLVNEMRSEAFLAAHPLNQAAYAHYGLVVIHPFADGNGRVARALASVFTYRAISMPIMILSEQKGQYLDALEDADRGDFRAFLNFMMWRSLDTMQLVAESMRTGSLPSAEESVAAINSLYVTKGGYSDEQVDEAGEKLAQAVQEELKKSLESKALSPRIRGNTGLPGNAERIQGVQRNTHRLPFGQGRSIQVELSTAGLAQAAVTRFFDVWVPKDAGREDDILLQRRNTGISFDARMEEILPAISGPLQTRVGLFAERVITEMLAELTARANDARRR